MLTRCCWTVNSKRRFTRKHFLLSAMRILEWPCFALVWVQDLIREQREIFGADPWPYNLEDNRRTLEAVIRYEFEQGMIKKKPDVEELFFPASLQRIQHYV